MARLKGQLFARLALDYFDHPKIAALSPEAIVAHLQMVVYARKYGTNGEIPMAIAMRFASQALDELASNDPESPSIIRNDDGTVTIHGYADMQETAEQVQARRQARAEAGRRGAESRWQKDGNGHGNSHSKSHGKRDGKTMAETETETETSIVADSGDAEAATAPLREDVEELCELLASSIHGNGSKRPNITKGWRDAARLMIDRDGRTYSEAASVITWSQNDEFWRTNILSMPKLREKYDQLRLRMEADSPQQRVLDPLKDW